MLIRPTSIFSKAITAGLSSSLLNSHRCRFGSTKSQTGIAKATAAEPILLDESEEDNLEEYLKRIRPYSSINYAAVHPATLERRVLIYDGICSLCHRGMPLFHLTRYAFVCHFLEEVNMGTSDLHSS